MQQKMLWNEPAKMLSRRSSTHTLTKLDSATEDSQGQVLVKAVHCSDEVNHFKSSSTFYSPDVSLAVCKQGLKKKKSQDLVFALKW